MVRLQNIFSQQRGKRPSNRFNAFLNIQMTFFHDVAFKSVTYPQKVWILQTFSVHVDNFETYIVQILNDINWKRFLSVGPSNIIWTRHT